MIRYNKRVKQFTSALLASAMLVTMLEAPVTSAKTTTAVAAVAEENILSGVNVLAANVYYKDSGKNAFTPYVIKEIKVGDKVCKVGIIGIENTDCSRFDVPDNFPNLVFAHPDNKKLSVAWEVNKYKEELKAKGCNTIIVSYHSGLGSADGDLVFETNTENQVARTIAETSGIDMVIAGHDHSTEYSNTYLKNKDGEDVLVVNGGGVQLTQTVFTVDYVNGSFKVGVKSSENLNLSKYEDDMTLAKMMEPAVEEASKYVNQECGEILDGKWSTATDFYLEQTDSMDLINRAQMAQADKYLSKQGKDNVKISSTSVVVSNNYVVKPGKISLKDIYSLYKFDNYLYIVPLTGKEIKTWMEGIAETHFDVSFENGEAKFTTAGNNFTNPVLYGVDFKYNLAKNKGSRVVGLKFADGSEVKEDETYNVAVNSYHIGQDPFTRTGKGAADAVWSSKDALGDDGGTVQSMIAEFIKEETAGPNKGVKPAPSNWELIYSGKRPVADEKAVLRIPVYETSDVHGSLVDTSSGKASTYQYRLAYLTSIIEKDRKDGDVLLLDGGDIYQGTPVSNLLYGEPMTAAYDDMKYDAVALGNHEFDWDVTTLIDEDGTMGEYDLTNETSSYKGDSKIPVVCSNIYDAKTDKRVNFTKDYTVVEKTAKNKYGVEKKVRVAILGYADDYSSDIMASKIEPYKIKEDIKTLEARAKEIKENEKADAVILLTHSGAETMSNALPQNSAINFVLGGHTHKEAADEGDYGIAYAQPKNAAQSYVYAELCFDPDTNQVFVENQTVNSITANKAALYDTEDNSENLDKEVLEISKMAVDSVAGTLNATIGNVSTSITKELLPNSYSSIAGNWFADLQNRSTNSKVSFANNGGIRTELTLEDGMSERAITKGDIYTIAPFNNQLYVYEMNYEKLKDVFEYAIESQESLSLRMSGATVYATNGKVTTILLDGEVIYHEGTWLKDKDTMIRVSTNSYVGTLRGSAFADLTPVDMSAVDNESFIRVLEEEAAKNDGNLSVNTDPTLIKGTYDAPVSKVRSTSVKAAEEKTATAEFVVLSTTDMHGKCWNKNILTDATVTNSFLRVSTAVKEIRAQYGKENVILIDNGDIYQGTQISSYNVAKGGVNNPMAICLKYIGYDVSVLGNHEFNFNHNTMLSIFNFLQQGLPVETPEKPIVTKQDISKASVGAIKDAAYTGKAITPVVQVKVNGNTLRLGSDYKVTYKNNVNAGTATVCIQGINQYAGTKTVTFKITKKSIAKMRVSTVRHQSYTGREIKPSVTVKDGRTVLRAGRDYTISYRNNKNTGKATITLTGKGNYAGTLRTSFVIVPKKPALQNAKSTSKKTVTTSWKKSTGATGYQVVYSTKRNGTYKSAGLTTKNSFTIKKLASKRNYYVKVRGYKTVDGKRIYGEYSTVKVVKTK